jgi:site-specific DNA-methyltransferase (adenine-specific)
MDSVALMPKVMLVQGRVEDVLVNCPDEFFDGTFGDPPYALRFMNKGWDAVLPPAKTWEEILRVNKPGANLLAFGGSKTHHRLFCFIEDGGWELRDCISAWMYGSGMPKSHDISKSIDKAAGVKRKIIGPATHIHSRGSNTAFPKRPGDQSVEQSGRTKRQDQPMITAPATPDAIRWDGQGTSIKPSWEPVCMAMKPRDGNFAQNALKHGVAGLNIDGCRLGRAPDDIPGWHKSGADGTQGFQGESTFRSREMSAEEIQARCGNKGRWPANTVLVHHPDCRCVGRKKIKVQYRGDNQIGEGGQFGTEIYGNSKGRSVVTPRGFASPDGFEEVEAWECIEGCPVRALDEQSGHSKSTRIEKPCNTDNLNTEGWGSIQENRGARGYADEGGASRFFYQAKASKSERERGLKGRLPCAICGGLDSAEHIMNDTGKRKKCIRNNHPSVKPISLCEWLARLILPPPRADGQPRRLLVPFAGSGSEVIGALRAGWDEIVAIEMMDTPEEPYCTIAAARITHALSTLDKT